MIYVTRLNGERLALNIDLIESIEETPDTIITLTSGKKFVVKESTKRIFADIIRFRKKCWCTLKQ
ncbi:MAG TPA: flagellar FlbD family protein [Syntrophomonadaceae bacterium]|nr:flagellar FlbD family protein [Syntrophomonadaceae bacterium]